MRRVLIVGLIGLLGLACLAGCGNSGGTCTGGQTGAALFMTARPASIEANGTDSINVQITGQDANCNPLSAGQGVEVRLTNQTPAVQGDNPDAVGRFPNGANSASLTMNNLGASTTITSLIQGTAVLVASGTIGGEYVEAIPVSLTFTEPPQDRCSITIAANPPQIQADGATTTTVSATVVAYDGQAAPDGTEVTFTTTLGRFTSTTDTNVILDTVGGVAQAILRSDSLASSQTAEVTATFRCDDPARTQKSNQVDVRFVVGEVGAFVVLSSSTNTVLADGQSTVDMMAEVYNADGTRAGAGELVTFQVNSIGMGTFDETGSRTYEPLTDAEGKAYATFKAGTSAGQAEVTASVYIDGQNAYDSQTINLRQVGQVVFIGATEEKLGVKGSGVKESTVLTFQVLDTEQNAFPDVLVQFSHSQYPGELTLDPTQTRTDANGEARVTMQSGRIAASVSVTATAVIGSVNVSGSSLAIPIVGAKPYAGNFTFVCVRRNIGGFNLANVHLSCSIALADRYSNKIGFPTNVSFRTEAGRIDPNVLTVESGPNAGTANVDHATGDSYPADVPPISGEPFIVDGLYTRNPRDGLVTMIAYTAGEEAFNDVNGNGQYDQGEPFVDLAEPFVDEDEDNLCDPSEDFVDLNSNNVHDGPNGVWDGDTQIWKAYWILWSGGYAWSNPKGCGASYRYSGICPETFDIPKLAEQTFYWEVKDFNLNPLNDTTSVDFTVEGTGDEGASSPALAWDAVDMLGVGVTSVKVNNVASLTPCADGIDPICYWTTVVNGYSGMGGWFIVSGGGLTDVPSTGTVSLDVRYQESPGYGVNIETGDIISGHFQ